MQKCNYLISLEKTCLSLCNITFNQLLNVHAKTQQTKNILKIYKNLTAIEHAGKCDNDGCGFASLA